MGKLKELIISIGFEKASMDKPKISIIVPVYQVEKYLNECITSIVNQTYRNLEIILVDDGSKDCCPELCEMWAEKDRRIRVIHKKNGGLSDARNKGLEVATGEYIGFVDSDDRIREDMYEKLYKSLAECQAEIAECGTVYFKDENIIRRVCQKKLVCCSNKEAMEGLISDTVFHQTVWNKLYSRKCLENILFETGKCNEDEFWTYQIFHNAQRVVAIPECCYWYRQREQSIMSSDFSYKRLDALEAKYGRMQFIEQKYPELYLKEKIGFVFNCIYFYQKVLKSSDKMNRHASKKKLIFYRRKVAFEKNEYKSLNMKDRIYIQLSAISLDFCAKVRNFLHIGL